MRETVYRDAHYPAAMRKPPRPASLILGLLLILAAIWRFYACAAAPPASLSGLAATTSTATASASAAPPKRARTGGPGTPLALLSASASPDKDAALGAFEGRVVSSATGRGIAGARLVLVHAGVAGEVLTTGGGAFRFTPTAPGTFTLVHGSATGFRPFSPAWGTSPIAWTARPGARVSGFVLALDPQETFVIEVQSPEGKPVQGAEVRVLGGDGGDAGPKLVTDAQGEVRADLARDALIEARHPDFAPGRARVTLAAEASHAILLRLRPKADTRFAGAGASIAGRVVGPDGSPVAGARVAARIVVENRAAAGADLHPPGADTSEADGTFRLDGLDPGAYDLVAIDDEHAAARAAGIPAGAEGVKLEMGAAGAIRGTVRDEAGKPVAAFSVVVSIPRGALEREHVTTRSFLDAEGRYAIEGLGSGDYELVAAALGAAPSAPAKATIQSPPGEPVTVDLALAHGATLRGTVTDHESAKPIAGARVELEGGLGPASDVPLLATASTGADGAFELTGLAAGLRSLSVSAEGHHGRVVSGIVVATTDPPPIAIALTPTKKGEAPGIELVGIGAVLTAKGDALLIGQVLPGGGAAEAGLAEGDAVLAIDGTLVTELGFDGAIGRIRGPEGSTVTLTIRKAGATEAIDIVVPRRRIKA